MAFWRASGRQMDLSGKGGQQLFSAANRKWPALHREAKHWPPHPPPLCSGRRAALAVQARSLRRLSPAKAAMGGASIQRDINHGD